MSDNGDWVTNETFDCPHCGHRCRDMWECNLMEGDIHECGSCSERIEVMEMYVEKHMKIRKAPAGLK